MTFQLACLRDPRLSAHALSATPVWLWSADATRVLWANAVGAAMFGSTPMALATRRFDPDQPPAAQILQLAATLSEGAAPRFEHLQAIGAGAGGTLTCACSRLAIADTPGILIVALERAGPDLTLEERARALVANNDMPAAVFFTDGTLLHAELPPGETSAWRKNPQRFVWQMDADGRFTLQPSEFAALLGEKFSGGVPWDEIARDVDPEGKVARAMAASETWSGIEVAFPLEGTQERVVVELSGFSAFDPDRASRGYRGFGVCRDVARLAAFAERRREEQRLSPRKGEENTEIEFTESATGERQQSPSPASPPAAAQHPLPASGEREEGEESTNVLPFRVAPPEKKTLSAAERKAFRALARRVSARLKEDDAKRAAGAPGTSPSDQDASDMSAPDDPAPILDRLPLGILIYRLDDLLYANRAFLDWSGYASLEALGEAGGLEALLIEPGVLGENADGAKALVIRPADGEKPPMEARLFSASWQGDKAHVLVLATMAGAERDKQTKMALRAAEADSRELKAILDTATDGVVVLDGEGKIVSANRSAEALFGDDELAGKLFADLFAPESQRAALYYLDGLAHSGVASVLNDGREVLGRVRGGGLIPLFMTVGRVGEDRQKFCAVFHDISNWKKAEEELTSAKRQAEKASSAKSDFLAKISHEMRTPLNAIIGFSEVMMEERFGPVGNDRYREYLKDIRESGAHLVSLINDLLDLSKIEAGKLDLTFASVNLNDLTRQCVAIMQPQANRERIIIRCALAEKLPPVVADGRSLRQIVLNLLSNSIKFTGAGGQVIVSTALTDAGEVTLRVRDTGIGMSEKEIAIALEPFRQLATSGHGGSGGTGLGLPLTKALAEANRASFSIKSAANAGTLVEITFPPTRVLAE